MPTSTIDHSPTITAPSKRVVSGAGQSGKARKPRQSGPDTSPLQPSASTNLPGMRPALNDDKAEKAARRKSAHFGELGVASGDGGPAAAVAKGQAVQGKRVVSALAVQAGKEGKKLQKRLSAVNPEMIGVSWEQRESKYEEWMKAAIDNKITSTNTWNFALIDYFHDMTLLRNGPDDQSINFQKASSTLDGCVKIWTSRVDSVATETGKLLSGLAGGGNADDAGEDGEEEGEDGDRPKAARKNATHRSESTLAKSFAALQVKKLELEFSVDPLFKKTSADFDEGGAMGLLMNHLGVDGRGRVVFDAGDAVVEEEMEEEDLAVEDNVDLTKLRQFVSGPDAVQEHLISSSLSSFKFSSDPSAMPDLTALLGLKDTWDDGDVHGDGFSDYGSPGPSGDGPIDFFGDEDFNVGPGPGMGGGGYGNVDADGDSVMGGDEDGLPRHMVSSSSRTGALGLGQPGENLLPFDPRRQGGELVMALAGGEGDGEEGMFDYFDKGFGARGWAGAEHWKLRKVTKKDVAGPSAKKADKEKDKKSSFSIDFASPLPAASSSKVLFAAGARSSIALPDASSSTTKSKSARNSGKRSSKESDKAEQRKRQKRDEAANLLPDDMHFSSRQLVRLFMKPKFALRMRRTAQTMRIEDANGEIGADYWAASAADRPGANQAGLGDSSMPPPFESQFFADGDDATDAGDFAFVDDALDDQSQFPGPDTDMNPPSKVNGGDGDGDGEDDLWQGTQGQIKRARPENVNFAKRAKRVDVKRLKDDIWSGLRTLVPSSIPSADSESESAPIHAPSADPEPKTFEGVITDLRRSYPREKMSEISTSFCFICLLHLANEEGLRIEAARFDGLEGEDVGCMGVADVDVPSLETVGKGKNRKGLGGAGEGEKVVGELQALRVYKDPNAGRAA